MSIAWINVKRRVPDDRRAVLAWGYAILFGINCRPTGAFLGATKFNPSRVGGDFDIETAGRFVLRRVTHWAEIEGPDVRGFQPPN